MLNRAWIEVDLGALVRNTTALRDRAGVPVIPMIKADAYGVGAVESARVLESLEPLAYGVATTAEGVELRSAGIARPILVFTPLLKDDFPVARAALLTPTLGSADEIRAWGTYGIPYHLAIDTGMARAGVPWREIASVHEAVADFPPQGAFTHFHSPALDDGSMDVQLERFIESIDSLPSRPPLLHTDSSAAICRNAASPWNAVRPGIFMYGVGSGDTARLEPEPVIYLHSRIVELRWIEPGDTVSYDATFTADSRRLIATVAVGYADGYPRGASGKGVAVVRDQAVPIAGRVTMDMIMLDVTGTGAEVGDTATLLGNPSESNAPVDIASVAAFADISPYELLTGLHSRIERVYRGKPG